MQDAVEQILRVAAPGGTVTSTYRSLPEQQRLWSAYQSGRSRLPAERPGNSTHHTGLAVDYVVREGLSSQQQLALGRLWQQLGGIWAGPSDPVHFQHPEARHVLSLQLTRPRWWL